MKDLNETVSIKSTTLHSSPGHYEYRLEVEGFGSTHTVEVLVRRVWGRRCWGWQLLQHQDGSRNHRRESPLDPNIENWFDLEFHRAINPASARHVSSRFSSTKARVENAVRGVILNEHCRIAFTPWAKMPWEKF